MTKRADIPTGDSELTPEVMKRREALQRVALLLGFGLSGATLEPALLRSIAAARSSGASPRTLSPQQLEQVSTIAEHIIPATDTPGARAVGVPAFVDTMLAEYYTAPEREQLLAGLAAIDGRARRAYGHSFLDSRPNEQKALLEALDRESFEERPESAPAFFRRLKELTVLGYYTSQPGATKELRYVQVPGRYDGCVPFAKIGREWAT